MIKKTITLPNIKLRKRSEEVKLPLSNEDKNIAENLISYLELAEKESNNLRPGIGLAAIQLGFLKRMFLVRFEDQHGEYNYELLINPVFEEESMSGVAIKSGEGCLSVKENHPGQDGLVHRKNIIVVSGYSYFKKKNIRMKKTGFAAIVYQHEMDHLNGMLFIDRIDKSDKWKQKKNEVLV